MRLLCFLPVRLAVSLLGLGLAFSAPAAAAEPSASEISVARRLFDEGRAATEAARWAEAASKFRRASAIKDTPGLRYHLARCEEEQGAFVEALIEYDRARELIDRGTRAADVEQLLPAARERVRAKVALLTLRVPDGIQNVSVHIDGKAVSASVLGVPMPINPGRHRVQAVAVGRTTFSSEISLGLGEVRELPLELPFATTAPAPPPPPVPAAKPTTDAASGHSGVSARTLVLVGEASLAAVGLGAGTLFMVSKSSAEERMHEANETVLDDAGGSDPHGTACNTPRPGCAEWRQAASDHERAANLALASFITAGVSAAAFGLTLWLWPDAEPAVAVQAAPSRGYLSITGRF
jgi:hypothetical protein